MSQPPHQHAHAGNVGDYTIADVYEDAAVIGSELERIISNYGSHVLKELMPKVIGVLELLEQLTLRKERETEQLHECRLRISSLEMEKMQRFNEREKFEKELEEIEEKWKQETLKLIGMVNKLKEENKRLSDTINKNNLNMKQNDQISKRNNFIFVSILVAGRIKNNKKNFFLFLIIFFNLVFNLEYLFITFWYSLNTLKIYKNY